MFPLFNPSVSHYYYGCSKSFLVCICLLTYLQSLLEIRKMVHTPLVSPVGANGESPATPTPAQKPASTAASSPYTSGLRTIFEEVAPDSVVELASDKTAKVKTRVAKLDSLISEMEELVYDFKGKVRGVAREFEDLKADIDALSLEFEAQENDHMAALACLEEERHTRRDYIGKLRNAEVEILHLYDSLSNGTAVAVNGSAAGGYSQAHSSEAIYERYA